MSSNIPGLPEIASQKILAWLQKNPEIEEAYLFGSRAKGTYKEGSDIDLCLKGPQLSAAMKTRLLLEYDDLYLPWKLDLIFYALITEPALKDHVDRVGLLIYRK